MTSLSPMEHGGLINAFSDLADNIDVLIVDTAAGISEGVVSFLRASQEILMVVCDEPTSITDAYALIKLLNRDYGLFRFRILANMVRTPQEGRVLFAKLSKVIERFLDEVALQYVGAIPQDDAVKKAVQRQRAVVEISAIQSCHRFAGHWLKRPTAGHCPPPRGHLEFFL